MDRVTTIRTKSKAKAAAQRDLLTGREATNERARWWVGAMSHKLGIVDAHGMIDVDGEVARMFIAEYKRAYRSIWRTIGVG